MEATLATPPIRETLSSKVPDPTISRKTYLADFETFLLERVEGLEEDLRELARNALCIGGKRIRPTLVHACGNDNVETTADLLKAGAIVEFVHVATLVHDDVLDDASIRRGRRSLYASHGATAAILLGDALFAHALEMAAEFPGSEVCRWVAAATRRTCSGEIRQSFLRGDYALSLAEYRRIIEAKTAELFRVSCFLGATLSNRDDVTCELVGEFGRRLGVAYQIYDDLADVFGQEEDFGKTLGRDLAHGKVTLPTITLFSKLSQSKFTALLENLQNMGPEPDSGLIREIRNLLRQNGVLADSRACLAKELEATGTILDELEDDAMVSRLDDLRRVILARLESLDD